MDSRTAKLCFDAPVEPMEAPLEQPVPASRPMVNASLFGEGYELPPTWTEGSEIYHFMETCTRLQAIRKNRRITGRPGIKMRPCFNCEDIRATKRSG